MSIPFYQEVLRKSPTAYKPEQLTLFGPKLVHILGKFQIINLHLLCKLITFYTDAPLGPSPHTVAPGETKLHWRTPETYNPEQICLIFWHIEG